MLFFDFQYLGRRCREQTMLPDTAENRRTMAKVLKRIEAEITLGTFDYGATFPGSKNLTRLAEAPAPVSEPAPGPGAPLLKEFAWEWFDENEVRWKRSYRKAVKGILTRHLIPRLGEQAVSQILRSDILKFRSSLGVPADRGEPGLSSDRINHILTPLRMILEEASQRFDFPTPFAAIRQLRVPRTDVDPFSLEEVETFLAGVRPDFRNYYTVRFFTGLRTSEIDGLKWRYADIGRREILVRETLVKGVVETTKTVASARSVWMSSRVLEALEAQGAVTRHRSEFVFCDRGGAPLNYANVTQRVWLPTLERLGLRRRRAYQTRHTTATLWLAAGENPEWIAQQMGHTTTKMLFSVYSRFVPNLTRKDGSAFERLVGAAK
jgi:integrase